jgi:hypothetical protein
MKGKTTMKRRGRALKVKRVSEGADVEMLVEGDSRAPVAGHEDFNRRAGERKAVKSEVARLKAVRVRLGRGEREEKKRISQEIKRLLASCSAE